MPHSREKFAAQVDSQIFAAVRSLAQKRAVQLHTLIDETLSDLIEKHQNARLRPHVMFEYLASHEKYGPKLAA